MVRVEEGQTSSQPIEVPKVDPSRFGDPLADSIDWQPLGGAGEAGLTRTHTLVADGPDRLLLQGRAVLLPVGLAILAIGAVVSVYGLFSWRAGFGAMFGPLLVGLSLVAVGLLMIDIARTPIVFDRGRDLYQRGRASDQPMVRKLTRYQSCSLSDVRALQILAKLESSTSSGGGSSKWTYYLSYELNLVLGDQSRLNVLDHGDPAALRGDAATLAEFLGVPVWDGSRPDG
jgi:hypothetical protein